MSMLSIGLVLWVLFGAVAILMVRHSSKRRYSEVDMYFMAAFCGPIVTWMLLWDIVCELRRK